MWCRYGTWHEIRHGAPILQVARNALNCSELLCCPCRHGGARRSGEGAGYQGGAGHRDVVVRMAPCGSAGHRDVVVGIASCGGAGYRDVVVMGCAPPCRRLCRGWRLTC